MSEPRGVLWDMDGVLVDTAAFHFEAWSRTLQERGVPFDEQRFRATFGMNNTGILTALLGRVPEPDLVAEVSERKEALFRQAIRGQVRPLPGALEWLERLEGRGVRQALASSAPPENIAALVDELGIRPRFQALLSGFAMPGKPDPALFLAAAAEIGVPPRRCVVVEDAMAGVEAALRAGMRCIAVATTSPAHALGTAHLVVDRLDFLPPDVFERWW